MPAPGWRRGAPKFPRNAGGAFGSEGAAEGSFVMKSARTRVLTKRLASLGENTRVSAWVVEFHMSKPTFGSCIPGKSLQRWASQSSK